MIPSSALVALNPLQWFATEDGGLDWTRGGPWPTLLGQVREAGFEAVHTRVPPELSATEYGAMIRDAGLVPAPGTFAFSLPEHGMPLERTLASFREAALGYAELGLREIFVLPGVDFSAPRTARPAVGADADPARLDRLSDLLVRIGEVVTAEGVLPILHPHVGTWIETADEARHVLDRVDPALLGLGPDVGHLSWVGDDPVALIAEHRDRVRGMHVKDLRRDVRDRAVAEGLSYQETVLSGLWIEPGRGDIDYAGLWAALGDDFDGTIVVEVDRGDIQPPLDSARACARWVASQRPAA
ncbi:sugar phosphate isomerase/epimerase family protein [Brachybacterium sp. DNPG3]